MVILDLVERPRCQEEMWVGELYSEYSRVSCEEGVTKAGPRDIDSTRRRVVMLRLPPAGTNRVVSASPRLLPRRRDMGSHEGGGACLHPTTARHVPDTQSALQATCRQVTTTALWRKGQGNDRPCEKLFTVSSRSAVATQLADLCAAPQVPEASSTAPATRGEVSAARGEG